jgi:hypothetical protein
MRTITVYIEDREDGGVRVWSDDLPGLVLSGSNRIKVLADIEPAVKAILEHKGQDTSKLRIDTAFYSTPEASS